MVVSGLEPIAKNKVKVFIDEQFAFVLYKGELSRFHLRIGEEIEKGLYEEIVKNVVIRRAKLRALHLLTDQNRTEQELRTKLKAGLYSEDVIDQAIEYVKRFGYINDRQYVESYISYRKETKSKRQLCAELRNKGLSRELIDEVIETSLAGEDEVIAAQKLLKKRRYDGVSATNEEKQKQMRYLASKGFSYDIIKQAISC